MEITVNQLLAAVVAILSGAGFWSYMSARAAHKEKQEYALNELLKHEIQELKQKVQELIDDKEELLIEIATLRSELAAAKAELHAMTSALRYGRRFVENDIDDGK